MPLRILLSTLLALAVFAASARAAEREGAFASEFVRLCVKGEAGLAQTAAAEKWKSAGPEAFPRFSSWLNKKVTLKTWVLPSGMRVQSIHAAGADGTLAGGTCALATHDLDIAKLRAALLEDGAVKDATPPEMAGEMNVFTAANGSINLSHGKASAKFPGWTYADVLTLTLPR